MKKCLTYNSSKTQSVANAKLLEYCNTVLNSNYSTTEMAPKLCGVIYYTSAFLIPDDKLENEQRYTVENSCYYVPGLFKIPMHDLLYNLGDVCVNPVCATAKLHVILTDCLLPELLELLGVDVFKVICALSSLYFKLKGKNDLCDEIAIKYISSESTESLLQWVQLRLAS